MGWGSIGFLLLFKGEVPCARPPMVVVLFCRCECSLAFRSSGVCDSRHKDEREL